MFFGGRLQQRAKYVVFYRAIEGFGFLEGVGRWAGGGDCVRQLPWSQKDKDKKTDIIGDL